MRRLGQATTWLHATLSAWPTAGWAVGSWVTARSSALTCGSSEPVVSARARRLPMRYGPIADHRVEGGIGQLQRLGVPEAQVHPAAQLVGLASGQLQHGGAEVGPGQADTFWVEGEVAAGADGHLKDVAGGLRADPLPADPAHTTGRRTARDRCPWFTAHMWPRCGPALARGPCLLKERSRCPSAHHVRSASGFAAQTIAVAVQVELIGTDHLDRALHVVGSVAGAPSTVVVADADLEAFTLVGRMTVL
jgi:hypothetical protein